jgi:hypothetical protein
MRFRGVIRTCPFGAHCPSGGHLETEMPRYFFDIKNGHRLRRYDNPWRHDHPRALGLDARKPNNEAARHIAAPGGMVARGELAFYLPVFPGDRLALRIALRT